jgi:hypothetical protein
VCNTCFWNLSSILEFSTQKDLCDRCNIM